jgi:hypothetical protein
MMSLLNFSDLDLLLRALRTDDPVVADDEWEREKMGSDAEAEAVRSKLAAFVREASQVPAVVLGCPRSNVIPPKVEMQLLYLTRRDLEVITGRLHCAIPIKRKHRALEGAEYELWRKLYRLLDEVNALPTASVVVGDAPRP